MKIVLATHNEHKYAEMSALLSNFPIEILSLKDFSEIGEIIEDFSQISKLTSASVMNQDEEELAYMEVVEYVRVGVQLIFEEMQVAKT